VEVEVLDAVDDGTLAHVGPPDEPDVPLFDFLLVWVHWDEFIL